MRAFQDLLLTAIVVGGCSTTTAYAQAIRTDVVERFDSVDAVQFVSGDWNPADGDTVWLTRALGSSVSGLDPYELEFAGPTLTASFSASTDPWENVAIQSLAGRTLALAGTAEFQLLLKPNYQSERPTVSVLLRLTMRDGSIWDQTKVVKNRIWQRAAFPVNGEFARVSWGPEGSFDLSNVASWQVMFVDLPAGQHSVELHALHAKRPASATSSAAEPFGTRFFSTGGASTTPEANLLFRRGDWNTADGDTDWLFHRHKVSAYYSPSSFLQASYRSAGDPWETVSIHKAAATRFDLAGAKQIVARLSAERNVDPNALVMSLTMEDGSVWQQGKPIDVPASFGYTPSINVGMPYRFALDQTSWTRADWGPYGHFDLDRVRSWELYFNNLGTGVHEIQLQGVELTGVASAATTDSTFQSEGQARWVSQRAAADGVRATIAASGGAADRVAVRGQASAVNGFLIEVTSSYSSTAADAIVFRLSSSDGETRDISFALPESGRTLMRVHTTCPALPPGTMVRSPAEMENRCRLLQGNFYALDLEKFDRWELRLQNIPAGEHSVKLAVFPQVE
ncbi:MAG TPA: hypothetical protein VFN67_35340 [Polyangiales bacterium]|nr:hypothetical protein [Polyangiales bacterium]